MVRPGAACPSLGCPHGPKAVPAVHQGTVDPPGQPSGLVCGFNGARGLRRALLRRMKPDPLLDRPTDAPDGPPTSPEEFFRRYLAALADLEERKRQDAFARRLRSLPRRVREARERGEP